MNNQERSLNMVWIQYLSKSALCSITKPREIPNYRWFKTFYICAHNQYNKLLLYGDHSLSRRSEFDSNWVGKDDMWIHLTYLLGSTDTASWVLNTRTKHDKASNPFLIVIRLVSRGKTELRKLSSRVTWNKEINLNYVVNVPFDTYMYMYIT